MQQKVLIADDEKDVLDVLVKHVARAGYEVIPAEDGQQAWDRIQSEIPDIIILDLNMPHKDGLDVLKEIRDNPHPLKWQPVIIVSARNELEDLQKGFTLEADHYITKPCDIKDVLKAIKLMVQLIPQRRKD